MKKEINKDDYDFYHIQLPLSHLFGKRKIKFISSELEKRHPCFTENNRIFPKVKIGKKGPYADVIVLDSFVLANYQNQYPDARLFTEKGKLKTQKNRTAIYIAIILSIVLIAIIVNQRNEVIPSENTFDIQMTSEIVTEENNILVLNIDSGFEAFLPGLKNRKNIISGISWNIKGNIEEIDVTFTGIHPMDLPCFFEKAENGKNKIKISSVNFTESIPSFSLSVNTLLPDKKNVCLPLEDKKWFVAEIRNHLIKNNVVFLSEEISDSEKFYSVIFYSKTLDVLYEKDEEIFYNANEYAPVLLEINFEPQKGYLIKMSFCENSGLVFNNHPFNLIYKNKEILIKPQEKITSNIESPKKQNLEKPKEKVNKEPGRKIGKIVHENGTESVYYKNEKGKIVNAQKN